MGHLTDAGCGGDGLLSHHDGMLPPMFTDGDRMLAAIAATQHGVFTTADAGRSGLSEEQIHHRSIREWYRLHEGVFRVLGAPVSFRGELYAATRAVEDLVAVSHRSAAVLYELPGARTDIVEITCRRWFRTQKPGLVVHESTRLHECDITEVDGIKVTTPERCVLDLAGLRPPDRTTSRRSFMRRGGSG